MTYLHPDFTQSLEGFDPIRDTTLFLQSFKIVNTVNTQLLEVYRNYPKGVPLETCTVQCFTLERGDSFEAIADIVDASEEMSQIGTGTICRLHSIAA